MTFNEDNYDNSFWDDIIDRNQTMFWINSGTCICISPITKENSDAV